MLCGKMAAGKSTLAAQLATEPHTLRLTQDDWLAALYGDDLRTGKDFMTYSARLETALAPHVADLLRAGLSVVLDFAANTPGQRAWMRGVLDETGAAHVLHVLTPPDAVCLARLKARNAAGTHAFAPSEAMFHAFSKHFIPPTPEEGFTCRWHDA